MKQKFDFTPAGVTQKMDQLYAQSPTAIEAEAVAVETDCNAWMEANFVLSQTQVDYMVSLGNTFSSETGDSLAHAFRNRLPVTMTKGGYFNSELQVHPQGTSGSGDLRSR